MFRVIGGIAVTAAGLAAEEPVDATAPNTPTPLPAATHTPSPIPTATPTKPGDLLWRYETRDYVRLLSVGSARSRLRRLSGQILVRGEHGPVDSRLRGNDVMGCGNDVMGCGNDVMGFGNDTGHGSSPT